MEGNDKSNVTKHLLRANYCVWSSIIEFISHCTIPPSAVATSELKEEKRCVRAFEFSFLTHFHPPPFPVYPSLFSPSLSPSPDYLLESLRKALSSHVNENLLIPADFLRLAASSSSSSVRRSSFFTLHHSGENVVLARVSNRR